MSFFLPWRKLPLYLLLVLLLRQRTLRSKLPYFCTDVLSCAICAMRTRTRFITRLCARAFVHIWSYSLCERACVSPCAWARGCVRDCTELLLGNLSVQHTFPLITFLAPEIKTGDLLKLQRTYMATLQRNACYDRDLTSSLGKIFSCRPFFSPQVTRLTKDNLENQDNDQHRAPKSHPGGWKSGGEFVSAEATRLVEMYSADRNTTFAVIAPRGWVMFSHTLRPSFANELSVLTHEH